jgi:hypothetical protein
MTHAGRLQEFLDSADDRKRITALFEEFDIK